MQNRLVAIVAFASCCWPVVGVAQHIQRTGGDPTLVLPPAMKAALVSFDPTFRPWTLRDYLPEVWRRPCRPTPGCELYLYRLTPRQAPFAVIGDFNGDHVLDVVVDGESGGAARRIVVLSHGRRFVASEPQRAGTTPEPLPPGVVGPEAPEAPLAAVAAPPQRPFESWIQLVRRGKHESGYEERPLILKTDAILTIIWDKSAYIDYLQGGVWHQYFISD